MNDSMYKYADIGIIQFMLYPNAKSGKALIDSINKTVSDEYFTAIEITHIEDDAERREVAEILEQGHLTVGYGAQPLELSQNLDLNSTDGDVRKKAVDVMKSAVDEAYELGAKGLALLSGRYSPDKRAKELLITSLSEICEYAGENGDLGIELDF